MMIRILALLAALCAMLSLAPRVDAQLIPTTTPRPCFCPRNIDYVCGADGTTYDNACIARCAGVMDYSSGRCDDQYVVHVECVNRRNVLSEIDDVTHARVGNWSFRVAQNATYRISTCNSDVDTQLRIDGRNWIDSDSCPGNYGEIYSIFLQGGTTHNISVRPFSSYRPGVARINISAPVVCANQSRPPVEEGLICGNQIRGRIAAHQNLTLPLTVTSDMLNTNVVVNSCGSRFDTVLRLLQNGVQLDYNDDNYYLCRNRSAALVIEGSQIVNRSVGTYEVVLEAFGTEEGEYSLALECGGATPEDPCNKCPTGTRCYTLNPDNETCRYWYRNHNYTEHAPSSCRGCFAPSDACVRQGHNCSQSASPNTYSYCTINFNSSSLIPTCCDNTYPKPDQCYSCASRLNPPRNVCPRPTPPRTTRPVRTITSTTTTAVRRQQCGPLEVFDEDTCDKFCSNAGFQGGASKQGYWSNRRCCCLDPNGAVNTAYCCYDEDQITTVAPGDCSAFGECARYGSAMVNSTLVLSAIINQYQHCDWTAAPGSPEKEACHAIQTAVHAFLGSEFYTCCPCIKRLKQSWPNAETWLGNLDCYD